MASSIRRWLPLLVLLVICAEPRICLAEEQQPTVFGYVFQGMGSGATVGLAVGLLLSRPEWESSDWATLGLGVGIGALVGMATALTLGVIDAGDPPSTDVHVGAYVLRDLKLGIGFGALGGALVGTIVWIGGGAASDLLGGLAYGVVIGSSVGLVLGIIEGILRRNAERPRLLRGFSFNVGFTSGPGSIPLPAPVLVAHF
jgi:hypothetical protein